MKFLTAVVCFGVLALGACSKGSNVRTCNPGTLLLSFNCADDLAAANGLTFQVRRDDGARVEFVTKSLSCPGTLVYEVALTNYSSAQQFEVSASPTASGVAVGEPNVLSDISLAQGCTALAVPLTAAGGRMMVGSGVDAATPATDGNVQDGTDTAGLPTVLPQCEGKTDGDLICINNEVRKCANGLTETTLELLCVSPTPSCMGGACGTCQENATRPCSESGLLGPCAAGTQTCTGGAWSACSKPPLAKDSCEAGNDDNCDGIKNAGCACVNGATQTCGAALGALGSCAGDAATCTNGQWTGCATSKGADSCDSGNDNSCNGKANEGCGCINGASGTCGDKRGAKGSCAAGTTTCAEGTWGSCSIVAKADACSAGNDDSCNGTPNEGCGCLAGATGSCGEKWGALGACSSGVTMCSGGAWGTCSKTPAAKDTCDAENDDNCDGTKNGGCACLNGAKQSCGTLGKKGACALDTATCVGGQWSGCSDSKGADSCNNGVANGSDNSCNGVQNEGCVCINGETGTCAAKLAAKGTCAGGTTTCVGAAWGACSVSSKAADTCAEGNDDSCDGQSYTGCWCGGFAIPNPPGVGLPNPYSYSINGDNTVTDNVTRLIWDRGPAVETYQSSSEGFAYCLSKGAGWRLASRLELVSLIDFSLPSPGPVFNSAAFPNATAAELWTSSYLVGSYFIVVATGEVKNGSAFENSNRYGYKGVRCVRSPTVPKCYPTAYQIAADTTTYVPAALTWQRNMGNTEYTLAQAKTYCSGLGGGWRLPSIAELLSIVDDETEFDPIIHPAYLMGSKARASAWSGSAYASDASKTWTVLFDDNDDANLSLGLPTPSAPTSVHRVRCVR